MDDLREVRTRFLDKATAYACCLRTELQVISVIPVAIGMQVRLKLERGSAFNVFPKARMLAADGREHDIPAGELSAGEESVLFRRLPRHSDQRVPSYSAVIEGRSLLQADKIPIEIVYSGILQWTAHPTSLFRSLFPAPEAPEIQGAAHQKQANGAPSRVVAKAFLAPMFETSHPKYHWLTESTLIAFGEWTLHQDFGADATATAEIDVYTTA